MPTYDYECKKCLNRFEAIQKMNDDPLSVCPKCNGEVKRLIGGGLGIIFKGSGFYSTDNRKSSNGGPGSVKNTSEPKKSEPDKNEAKPPAPEVAKAS
jgi:putative FmdB family regulatory protein